MVDSTSADAQLPGQNPAFSGAYKQLMSTYPGEPALQAEQATSGANLIAVGTKAAAALSQEQPPAELGWTPATSATSSTSWPN